MSSKILTGAFFLTFAVTPIVWSPLNYELFEYNKMMLVYLLTVVIVSTWIVKMAKEKRLILKRTPLDIPLLLFLAANFLSTVFSIDKHVSIWGYYSRSNGGLLSIICYILLYYALVSNYDSQGIKKFFKAIFIGGVVASLWAIPEHFGVSPSCLLLTGQPTASCWVQDVQARVFSTLGQPNWLAAYLAMLIFPALYFLQTAKTLVQRVSWIVLLTIYYLAFTFTYSRGGTFGLIAGLLVYLGLQFAPRLIKKDYFSLIARGGSEEGSRRRARNPELGEGEDGRRETKLTGPGALLVVLGIFIVINLVFGSALTTRAIDLKSKSQTTATNVTQLESGGTESGAIRLIVWRGALEIFKHYPVFGSGVETFAYSYYQYRPQEHNLVSEWDFLYNKAHNEYLNYLATTGALGLISYLLVIGVFIAWSIKYYVSSIKQKTPNTQYLLLTTAILASYSSFLIQNMFGFSVVVIALLFYTLPAFVFADGKEINSIPKLEFLARIFNKRSAYSKTLRTLTVILAVFLVYKLFNFWIADTYFARGTTETLDGNPGQGYNLLTDAVALNKNEPLYRSELGYSAASAAVALQDIDATLSAQITKVAEEENTLALASSPNNISLWRTAIRTFFQLSSIDPKYTQKTLDAFEKAITLAPTDPKLYQSKAQVFKAMDKQDEAIEAYKKAIELKPNYREAYLELGEVYQDKKEVEKALENYNIVLKLVPNDKEALEKISELEGK